MSLDQHPHLIRVAILFGVLLLALVPLGFLFEVWQVRLKERARKLRASAQEKIVASRAAFRGMDGSVSEVPSQSVGQIFLNGKMLASFEVPEGLGVLGAYANNGQVIVHTIRRDPVVAEKSAAGNPNFADRHAALQWELGNLEASKGKSMSDLKTHLAGKVTFQFYRAGNLYYLTETGLTFPVPISDTGEATFSAEDKAILFMRYIRKHLETLKQATPPVFPNA